MKTTIYQTLGLLFIATALASAQSRFSVSVTAAPTYAYANTRINLFVPDGNGQVTTETFSSNTSSFGYGVGAMAHYAFSPNWSVSTGLWYNRSGRVGIFPFEPGDIPARIIQQDLQIPLLLNYRSSQKRLSPYFSVGTLADFPRSTLFRKETNTDQSTTKVLFNTSADYRAVLGVGISYKLTQRLSLLAQPLLIWHFKPSGNYEQYTVYQVNGQVQLLYSL